MVSKIPTVEEERVQERNGWGGKNGWMYCGGHSTVYTLRLGLKNIIQSTVLIKYGTD